jgi:hypothetical protein
MGLSSLEGPAVSHLACILLIVLSGWTALSDTRRPGPASEFHEPELVARRANVSSFDDLSKQETKKIILVVGAEGEPEYGEQFQKMGGPVATVD